MHMVLQLGRPTFHLSGMMDYICKGEFCFQSRFFFDLNTCFNNSGNPVDPISRTYREIDGYK